MAKNPGEWFRLPGYHLETGASYSMSEGISMRSSWSIPKKRKSR
jgi:hypothetical protein